MGKRSRDSAYLFAESISRMGAGFVVSILIARVYGAEGLGIITTGSAWVTIVLGFSALGLSGVLIREMVSRPRERGALIATVTLAKLCAGAVLLFLLIAIVLSIEDDVTLFQVIVIMGLGYLFAAFDTVDCLYNADQHFRRLVSLRLIALLASTSVKLCAIWFEWGLGFVALGYALDYALVYVLPAGDFLVRQIGSKTEVAYRFSTELPLLRRLLKRSWPVLISGGFAQLNLKVDALLIAMLTSFASVGLYSAAARLSEAWSILAMAIVTASFPALVKVAETDPREYGRDLSNLMRLLIWISLIGGVLICLLSPLIIAGVYGSDFSPAATVLAIHVFGGLFLFLRVAVSRWLIIENLLKLSLVSHALGAAVNVSLNFILIPVYGIYGAAWAAVASYATSAFFFLLVTYRSRLLMKLILWSALPAKIANTHVETLAIEMHRRRTNEN